MSPRSDKAPRSRTGRAQNGARSVALLRAAFEASGAGILAVDADGRVTVHNQRLLDMWGIPEDVLLKTDRSERIRLMVGKATEPEKMVARIEDIYKDPESESVDTVELGDGRCVEITSMPQRLDDGTVIGRVWSFRDITYQHRIEKELRELSIRDALTGLFNRRHAEEQLEIELSRARRNQHPLAVAMLDIDRFKQVNDAHGHQVGDDVLRAAADDMRKRLRNTDVVCRWGGEEFLVIMPATDRTGAFKGIDLLRRYVGRERKDLPRFTVSGGVAAYDGTDPRWDTLVKAADRRLYEAKEAGRNRIC